MIAGTLEIQMMANFARLIEDVKKVQQTVGAGMDAIERSVGMAQRAIGGLAAGFSIAKLVDYADAWGQLSSRMNAATGSTQAGEAAMKRLMDVSNRVYKPIADTSELFIRTSESLKQLGYTTGETVDMVETLFYGLTVSSASADKTKSVIDAWSKSMLQGKMTMGEYQTVISGAPALQKAMADALGTTIAGLHEMVSKGQLSADKLMLVTSQMEALGKQADSMPVTVRDAWTKMANSLTQWAGEANGATSATGILTGALSIMADNVGPIVTMLATMVGLAVAQWLGLVGAAAVAAGGGFTAAALAVKGFMASLGPIGWAILLIGTGVAAWQAFGNRARDAGKQVSDAADQTSGAASKMTSGLGASIDGLIKKYDELIAKQRETLGLAPTGVEKLGAEYAQISERIKDIGKSINDINQGIGKFSGMSVGQRDSARSAALESMATQLVQQAELDKKAAEARGLAVTAYVQDTSRMTEAQRQALDLSKAETAHTKALAAAGEDQARVAQINAAYQAEQVGIRAKYSKASAQASKQEEDAYKSLMTAIQAKIAAEKIAIATGDNATESDKMRIKYQDDLKGSLKGISEAQKAGAEAGLAEWAAQEKLRASSDAMIKAQKDLEAAGDKEAMARAADIQKINEQAQALEDEIDVYGLGAAAIAALTIERLEEKKAILSGFGVSAEVIAQIEAEIEARSRLGRAKDTKGGMDAAAAESKRALQELDNFLDPAKASSFGEALTKAFEGAGSALASMVNSLDSYAQKEAEIAKMRANLSAQSDPAKRMQQEAALAELSSKAQINAYASMAGAAKGFFKEGSAGYKTMGAVEKSFRAVELAMAVKNTAIKMGLIGVEVAASGAAEGQKTAISNAGELGRMPAKIAGAFASFMSMMGPFGIPAAIAAFAAVGIIANGSSSNALPPTNDGTGTVFGDASAKSESIEKTIDLLEGISKFAGIENSYAAKMLASLRSIESKIAGFTNVILRAGGIDAASVAVQEGTVMSSLGKNIINGGTVGISAFAGPLGSVIGAVYGKAIAPVMAKLFGTKTKITGQGIYGSDATLSQIGAGDWDAGYYADVNKKKKTFGFTTSNKNSTNYTPDDEVSRQVSLIITSFEDAVKLAGPVLGFSLDTIDANLQDFVVKIGRIDLKDLSGEEIQEKLNAVFGAAGDDIARAAIPGLEHLQQVGEGYFETLARVASNLSSVNQMFDTLGVTLLDASIAGAEASIALAELFGGLENMSAVVGDYYEAFYSEEERKKTLQRQLDKAFSDLGVVMPDIDATDARAQLRAMVDAALEAGDGSEVLAAKLMLLSAPFASITAAAGEREQKERENLENMLQQQHGLWADLAAAQGDNALAAQRRYWIETAGMTEAEQAAYDYNASIRAQISAANDAAAAVQRASNAMASLGNTRFDLENQLFGLQGMDDTVAQRIRERDLADLTAGLDAESTAKITAAYDYNVALREQIKAQEAANAAVQQATQAASEAQRAADQIKSAWQSVTDSIFDEVRRIRGLLDADGQMGFAQAQAEFAVATAQARAGDQDAAKLLPGLSNTLLDLAVSNASTLVELQLLRARTGNSLAETGDLLTGRYGLTLPQFADGGYYPGGMALVGERGPEIINFAQPAQVYTATQTRELMGRGGGGEAALLAEVRQLREQVAQLTQQIKRDNVTIKTNTGQAANVLLRVETAKGLSVVGASA